MAAGKLNLVIEQGATFKRKITLKDSQQTEIDLTGATFDGKLKKVAGNKPAVASFTFEILDQVTNTGEFYFSLTATETGNIPVDPQTSAKKVPTEYAYDIEMTLAGVVERIVEGVASVSPQVTK